MLRTQYPTDYLKKEGVNSEVAEPIEEQHIEQGHRSFQPKHRVRRQYNPDDTNIAKLFLAIREHKTGNPQLDKTNEIKGLLLQIQNINDIDFNDNGNTPLHVAVSKGHQDIVELLLKEQSIDINIKNNIGKTPLDIAKESNKEGIAKVLETQKISTGQESLVNHPQPGPSSQVSKLNPRQQSTAGTEVNGRLEKFVEYFVKEFEDKLHAYQMILAGEVKKAGKFSDTFSGKIGQGVGGGVGGVIGLFLLSPAIGARVGATAGKEIGEGLGSRLGNTQHTNKVASLLDLINHSQKDKANFRQTLVEAGFDVFQSFEMQFMRVTTDLGSEKAMQKLAQDAVNRAISHMESNKDTSINESVILGKSKIESVLSVPIPTSRIKTPGFEVQYEYQSNKDKWSTASLYEKAGLVIIESGTSSSYYKKKDQTSRTSKYGYRRLLTEENWDGLKDRYDSDNVAESHSGQFTDYQYILNSVGSKEKSQNMLDYLNSKDENLMEERIREVLGEVKNDILEGINVLKEQSNENHVEDHEMLVNIENSLKNLKIDEYLEEFKHDLEEAKQERQEIAHSIEEGREENREGFKQVNQKLDEIRNAVVIGQENNQVRGSVWFEVRNSAPSFTGREDQLNKIAGNIQQKMVVITGESGVGKSELAIRYARSKYSQGSVIWINAKTPEAIKRSFCELAKYKLKIKFEENDEAIKFLVHGVYEHFVNKKSLFIFDNAEKYSAIEKFLPLYLPPSPNDDKPCILITSTNSQRSEWTIPASTTGRVEVEIVELNSFDRSKAKEFIKNALEIKDESQDQDIIELAEKLHDFPLLLECAVVDIKEYQKSNSEFKISNYVESLNFESTLHIDMLSKILKVRIDKIKKEAHGQEALKVLNIIAYFASGSVQEEIFLELVNNDRIRLDNTIHLLTQYSVVKQGSISMHELVQQVIRSELQGDEGRSLEEEKTLEQALNLLKERMKSLDSVEHYVPHIISIWNHASKYDTLIENFIVNAVDSESAYTAYFHLIVENSSNEVVTAILDQIGSDKLEQVITARRKDQKTLLHCAAIGGNEQTVRLLVDKGATVNVVDKLKNTPLHLAAKNGYLEVVNFLLDRENNVNAKTQYKFTPLHLAVKNGHLKVVEALLGKGADVTAATNRGFTALHFAADNKQEEIVDVLLDLDEVKANINSKTRHEYTSLHLAAKSGHIGITNKLLAKGASVDAKTRLKFTPLHLAAKHGHKDVILTLIEKGADVNAKNQDGFTPLHLAAQGDHIESVNALLGKSALINAETKHKFTPLHLAAFNGRSDVVGVLVGNGADINAKTTKGNTPLHFAAESGNLEIVKFLTAKNPDIIDVENEEGNKPFNLAVKEGNLEVGNYIRQQTFNRRPGTSGISGQLYEIQLLMLFLLKGPEKTNGFHLATNVKEAGDFDDVVFKYKDQGGVEKTRIIFLQAKHKDNTDKDKITIEKLFSESEKGDFNLKKYFNSYRKIKQRFSEEKVDTMFGSKFEDSDFIIYTNALPNFGKSDKSVEKIAVGQEDILNLEENRHYYKLSLDEEVKKKRIDTLKYASDCKKLARELVSSIFSDKELDINEGILRDYHIPLADKVIKKKEGKGKLRDSFLSDEDSPFRNAFFEEVRKKDGFAEKLEDELKSELRDESIKLPDNFGTSNTRQGKYPESLPSDLVTEDEIKEFLSKLKLFVDQPSESELSKIIKSKIKEVYRVAEQDIDSVFSDVEYRVRKWWQTGNKYLTEDDRLFHDAARISIKFDVKDPVPLFTGRQEKLQELHRTLQNGGQLVISQMASVTGLGGVGKSELARKYISEHSKDYDDNVIWINADNYLTTAESFRKLAKDKLGISTTDENGKEKEIKLIVEDVYRFFAKRHRKSLFVFDNAGKHKAYGEEDEGIDKFLPSGSNKPSVLITSRDQEWGTNIAQLQLDVFTEGEAVEFIRKALGIEDGLQESEIKNLAKELYYLPLALQQAVAYINKENQGLNKWSEDKFTISDYLELYKEKAKELLDKAPGEMHDRYTNTVLTTWQITIDKIKQKKMRGGEQALEILNIIAYLAPDKIPIEGIFSNLINSEEELHSAVELLDQYSMANLDGGKLSIHRLVQQVTRINLEKQNKEISVLRKALTLLKKPMEERGSPTDSIYTSHAISAWGYTSKHDELVKEFSKLPSHIIDKLDDSVRYEEACLFGTEALELLERTLGPNHPDILPVMNIRAGVFSKRGNYKEALTAFKEMLGKSKQILGLSHPDTLMAENNIAVVLDHQGEYNEALEAYKKVLEERGNILGNNHYDTLMTENNIAVVLQKQGEYNEALKVYQEVLEKLKQTLGNNHLDTLMVENSIAVVLKTLGQYEKALEIYQQVLNKRKQILGDNHPDTLLTMHGKAVVFDNQGEHDKALEIYQKVLEKRKQVLGDNHPDTLGTESNIAGIFFDKGEYEKALEVNQEVLEKRKQILGDNHPDTLMTMHNIALVLESQGKDDEALEAYQEVLEKRKQVLGDNHPDTLMTESNMAGIFFGKGEYERALRIYQKALTTFEQIFGYNHPHTNEIRRLALQAYSANSNVAHADDNRFILHNAIASGDLNKVRELIAEGANVNTKDIINGATPLHIAVKGGYQEIVELLLEKQADPNIKDKNGEAPLDLVLEKLAKGTGDKSNPEIIEILLRTTTNESIESSLHRAVESGKLEVVRYLISNSADVNAENSDHMTPLHLAAQGGHQKIVELLLEKQADPNIRNNNEKTPLDLANERLRQDQESESLKTITVLLLSVTDESKSQHQEEQAVRECLPGPSSGNRRKREAKECELFWDDVDEFNEEKEEVRDFSRIKINSDKFINYIKSESMSEAKLTQLVQLADKSQVIGKFQDLVNKLTSNQKVMSHLNRVGRVSGIAMHGMMAKNVVADFLNGDGAGVAINLGFIAGGQGFARVAQAASVKGAGLVLDGKLMLGRSLKAASPFLARGTSAFVMYDLVNQIKAFKNGTEEALVGVIGDSIYLGVDAAEVGIEIAEAFEIFEGVSSITGPIGATIGAVVFVGTDVYLAVKRVDKVDEIIHLTTKERFIEGLRAFIGMNLEGYIEELMGEKQVNNQLVEQGLEYLKQHDNIQRYVFPTGKSVIDSCHTVQYREQCLPTGLRICYEDELGNLFTIKKREKCTTKLQVDLDNKVLLDKKRTDIKWSRGRPNDSGPGEFLCLPQGNYESVPSNGTYLCENAIGIEYTNNRTESTTLISLGNGDDVVIGFPQGNHIVVLGDGHKNITLGDGNDTILLEDNNITGVLRGGNGTNTLDLERFAQEEKSVHVGLSKALGHLYYESADKISGVLGIHEINDVLLRKDKQDKVYTACGTRYVDGRGGRGNNSTDSIIIPHNGNCSYEMKLIVRPYTEIKNYAVNGSFTYIVPRANKGEAYANLITRADQQSNHRFVFSYTLYDVNDIEKINNTVSFSFIENVGHLRFDPRGMNSGNNRYTTDYEFNITNNAPDNTLYQLSDNTEIKVGERNIYAIQSTNRSVDEIVNDYPTIANNLKMSIFVQSLLNNETVAVGHGNHDVLHNDPYYKSHLVGNGGENIFVVTSGYEVLDNNKLPIPEVVIYDLDKENLIDTLDLRQIKQQIVKDLDKEVKAKTFISNKDLLIELLCFRENQVEESVVKVRLKDALLTNWYERLHVIVDNVPMKIEEFELKPLPLIFNEGDKNIIVIGPQDLEEENKVIVSKEIGNYTFARSGNNLIITNAFDRNLTSNEFCTISLNGFYQEAKMQTLDIKFADKEIILNEHQEQISIARDIDVMKKEHKDQIYNDVFNRTMSSSEVNKTTTYKIRHKRRHEHQNATVKYLIDKGTDVNFPDNDGQTPLHLAAQESNLEAVKYMIDKGVDVNTKDNYGNTLLHEAASSGNLDLVQYLIEEGADVNAKTNGNWTPLHKAAEKGNEKIVLALLEKGVDVNAKTNGGYTALHWAALSGNKETILALLNNGANVNAKIDSGETPLHLAASKGNKEAVLALLNKGADVKAKDDSGWTPLRTAEQHGKREIVTLLSNTRSNEKHRHEHSRHKHQNTTTHQRSRRAINEENIASSAARVGSSINDLFGWVKSSIGGLFNSRAALPENNTTQSSISQIDAQVNVDGTIMLLDLLIRKVTGQKHISTEGQSISLLEAQGYALNITTKFEQVLNETAVKSGISATSLNFNPVAVQSTLAGQIRNGKFSEMLETLYSSAEKACPDYKQTDKFLAHLKSNLKDFLAEKEVKLLVGKQKPINVDKSFKAKPVLQVTENKPKSLLGDIAIENSSIKRIW